MRAVKLVGIVALVLTPAGCTAKSTSVAVTPAEFDYELARTALVELTPQLAADIVASIVFASAPPGGTPPVATLCADAGWRLWWAHRDPYFSDLRWVPSPLDAPDPEKRTKILSRPVSP